MADFVLVDRGEVRWAEWAVIYGKSERTLKRWDLEGREKNDPCPLHNPAAVPGWWVRNMSQRVPPSVLAAAAAVDVPVATASVGVVVGEAGDDEVGIYATLKRLQDLEVFTHTAYKEAISQGQAGAAGMALKSFKDLASEVVKVREKWRDDQVKMRALVPRVEAEAVFSEIHVSILTRFRGMAEDVFRLFGMPMTPQLLARWNELIDVLCTDLQREVLGG